MAHSRLLILLTLSLGLIPAANVHAQQVNEWTVKATMLYRFAFHVTWPEGRPEGVGDRFVIGILGRDPFGEQIRKIERNGRVGERAVEVKRFNSINDYSPCHILYVSPFASRANRNETAQQRLDAALRVTQNRNVLVVSDHAGAAQRGSAINFSDELDPRTRVRRRTIEINRPAAQRQSLEVDADLLKLSSVRLVQDNASDDRKE